MTRPSWPEPPNADKLNPKSYFDTDTTPFLDPEDREDANFPFFAGIARAAVGLYEFERLNARLNIIRNQLNSAVRQFERHQGAKSPLTVKLRSMHADAEKVMVQFDQSAYNLSRDMFERFRYLKDQKDGVDYEG